MKHMMFNIPFVDARTPYDTFEVLLSEDFHDISDDRTTLTLPNGSVIVAKLIEYHEVETE